MAKWPLCRLAASCLGPVLDQCNGHCKGCWMAILTYDAVIVLTDSSGSLGNCPQSWLIAKNIPKQQQLRNSNKKPTKIPNNNHEYLNVIIFTWSSEMSTSFNSFRLPFWIKRKAIKDNFNVEMRNLNLFSMRYTVIKLSRCGEFSFMKVSIYVRTNYVKYSMLKY